MERPTAPESSPAGWLRALAIVGALVLPFLWMASLWGQPDFVLTNLVRVIAAVIAGGIAGAAYRPGERPFSWQVCLVAGLIGSIAVSALSILLPVLGRFDASGWLVSGLVGGAMVTLVAWGLGVRPSARGAEQTR